jgi:hypothetical protein
MIQKYLHNIKFLPVCLILTTISAVSFSQEKESIRPYLTFQYYKDTDNHRFLQTTLTYSQNRMELPLAGMEISFYNGNTEDRLLATIITDEKGIARYPIEENAALRVDRAWNWPFKTLFKGNDSIEAGESELTIRDVNLELAFSLVDSVKTISLNAKVTENGKEKPVPGETVLIYVPRMFSLLPIAEVTLDDNGEAVAEFPSDLPGDEDGNVTIIARFEENPVYGNVEKRVIEKWGVPKVFVGPTAHRALWTKTAPRWMIITLSILLTGVWGHYLFAIISLIRIKLESKKKDEKGEILN